ncbi:putative leucine-rich repeat receptor-like protein kinase IMK3 [Bidens hawaiensis]|uniref:putative leucine-rich repeat receptor-like protein kinase IMK3 n=1 Tax=Bidens hawaiensis TaxID=980011 RepID=UPI004049F58B
MESNFIFHKYPSHTTLHFPTLSQSLHQCNITNTKNKQKCNKTTHCFTLLTLLLIWSLCFPYLVSASSKSWDGINLTKLNFEALISFKQELIDPKGLLKSWNDSGYRACSGGWVGIKCVQGQVIVIQLPWRGLGGQLTSKIGQLQALRKLSLHDNTIGGSIPKELGFLMNLKGIQLFNNKFAGSIPHALGSCTLLQNLDLSHNQFDGEVPSDLGNLVNLKSLDLSYNYINGSVPESFSNLVSLTSLNLAHNNLSGHVPVQLASRFNASSFMDNIELCGYSNSTMCPVSPPKSRHCQHRKLNTIDILLIAGGALMAVLLLLCCVLIFCLLKKDDRVKDKGKDNQESGVGPTKDIPAAADEGGEGGGKLVHFEGGMEFSADDLVCARVEIMGKSSYGTVYKASLVEGDLVVVRLRDINRKNENEFENEVISVGKIRHENLLAMRAYYIGPNEEKLLVFDYMPKGSLASFLHARGPKEPVKWPTRMRLIKGITRGLLNLHTNHNIIHGNLTSHNVLLDDNLNPKIADYAFSWLMATAGAHGYQAPELSKLKKPNTKTDIYSLGVIMLELLTRKSPGEVDESVGLPQWVALVVNEKWTNEVFDLELMKDASETGDELLNTLKLALHCVGPSPPDRPEAQVILRRLEDITPETAIVESGGGPSTKE